MTSPTHTGTVPAVSQVPTAGACAGPSAGSVVTVYVDPDTPAPRCVQVRADQHLQVINHTTGSGRSSSQVTVIWPPYPPRTLASGQATVFARDFGSYLASGVHDLKLSVYAGGGAEIWFKPQSPKAGISGSTTNPSAPSPNPQKKHASALTGVSCRSARSCTAVGWHYAGQSPSRELAIEWNGAGWHLEPIGSSSHDSSGLNAVSCASTNSCVAVGDTAFTWVGTRWLRIPTSTRLGSVSCPNTDFCQALTAPGPSRPAAVRWDGRAWHAQRLPQPTPRPDTLTVASVSCVSPDFCMAVGDYARGLTAMPSPAYRDRTLAEQWNGKRWQIIPTPNPSTNSQLVSVSCVSRSACTAVGASASHRWTLAERWNGRRWTIQQTPNVNRIGYTVLSAVSCASPTACTAVGNYNVAVKGISEHWNGTRWTLQQLPTPRGPNQAIQPAGISCPTATTCTMVGEAGDGTLAERWNGSSWTVQPVPNPT